MEALRQAPDWLRGRPLARRLSGLGRGWPAGRRPSSGSPRIGVVGNCQAAAVAEAMRLLLPHADIRYESVHRIADRFPALSDLTRSLADRDVVFASTFAASFRDGGDFQAFREATRLVQLPMIVFGAFHPDLIYVGDVVDPNQRRHVRSPVGDYNSALALLGFLSDFTVAETLRLFDGEAMSTLGYLDFWDGAVEGQLALGREAGWDLAPELLRWTRRGTFMHSINHPRMFVACDLARGALQRAAIPFEDFDLEGYAADTILRRGTWPVYPPVAEHFGVKGGFTFMTAPLRGAEPRTMNLAEFVAGSFALYARRPRADLVSPRVEAWRADPVWPARFAAWARG